MKRNKIRLTESQLHRVIKESVKKILRESSFPNYNQLINITGINDNDEFNAAAMTENKEELETEIWKMISKELCNGENPRNVSFHFKDLIELMKNLGFTYNGNDDDNESINFNNSNNEFVIYPKTYYPKMDLMSIYNTQIY